MTDGAGQGKIPGLHEVRFDRRLLTASEILAGAGAVLWVTGCMIGLAAVRRAAQDWFEQMDQDPAEFAIDRWQQLLHAAAAGTDDFRSHTRRGA